MISEERLKEIVRRVLTELGMEESSKISLRKIYMLCTSQWDERYLVYLKRMEQEEGVMVYPVIPLFWKKLGYEARLRACQSCSDILYRSCQHPEDLDQAITVFPVVPRDVVVKAALCIGDTFETAWIAGCIERGGQVVFAENSLAKFSGNETKPYVDQILSYYKTLFTYGINICGSEEPVRKSVEVSVPMSASSVNSGLYVGKPDLRSGKKRVITASNVSQLATDGMLRISGNDVVTDLAKDRAKFLNITLVQQDRER